jgi:hypothetical protein
MISGKFHNYTTDLRGLTTFFYELIGDESSLMDFKISMQRHYLDLNGLKLYKTLFYRGENVVFQKTYHGEKFYPSNEIIREILEKPYVTEEIAYQALFNHTGDDNYLKHIANLKLRGS